jgi:hypothetical protein
LGLVENWVSRAEDDTLTRKIVIMTRLSTCCRCPETIELMQLQIVRMTDMIGNLDQQLSHLEQLNSYQDVSDNVNGDLISYDLLHEVNNLYICFPF